MTLAENPGTSTTGPHSRLPKLQTNEDYLRLYSEQGFKVFPATPGMKKPEVRGWQGRASSDDFDLLMASKSLFGGKFKDSEIGVRTGLTFFIADGDAGEIQGMPPTPYYNSQSRGYQYLLKVPEDLEVGCFQKIIPNVDIKGLGGLAILPSEFNNREWVLRPDEVEVADCPEWLLRKIREKTETINTPTIKTQDTIPVRSSDEEIIEKALSSKNGERFRKLFYEGDISIYEDDHSDADMALCGMLAYWTRRDPERMDRIFRSSALLRDQWDEIHNRKGQTYGEMTIEEAIDNCTSIHDPEKYKNQEKIIEELHHQRMDAQWKSMEACMVYRAHISLIEEHPWFVEEGQVRTIHGKDVVIPETGMLIYSPVRDLSLGSGLEYKEDPRNISRANRNLEKMGLLKLIFRGGTHGSSCFLLPVFSLRTQKKETQSLTKELPEGRSVFPLCVLSEKLLWIQPLTTREKFILEQVAWGRNTVQSLAEYFSMDEKNLLYRNLNPLETRGLLVKDAEEYTVSTEKIEEMYSGSRGERAHEAHKIRVSSDREEHEKFGEEANLRRSMEKIESHLRGEIPVEDLSKWERNQAAGIGMKRLVANKSRKIESSTVESKEQRGLAGERT